MDLPLGVARSAEPELDSGATDAPTALADPGPASAGRGVLSRHAARPSVAPRRVARSTATPVSEDGRSHLSSVGRPRLQRSAAERIAEHTGGAVESGEGGLRTVHFPSPGSATPLPITTQQPYTITRELTEGGTSSANTDNASSAPASAPSKGDETKQAAEREAMYEYFVDRFKRDLLAEREQSGYLIIDNP